MGDVVEEVADIALQLRRLDGNAKLSLGAARSDEDPQVMLGQQVDRKCRVDTEVASRCRERRRGDRALEILRCGAQIVALQERSDARGASIPCLAAAGCEQAQA